MGAGPHASCCPPDLSSCSIKLEGHPAGAANNGLSCCLLLRRALVASWHEQPRTPAAVHVNMKWQSRRSWALASHLLSPLAAALSALGCGFQWPCLSPAGSRPAAAEVGAAASQPEEQAAHAACLCHGQAACQAQQGEHALSNSVKPAAVTSNKSRPAPERQCTMLSWSASQDASSSRPACRWVRACMDLEALKGQAADLAPACWQVKHTATVIDPGREKEKRAQERERTIRSKDALTRRQASVQLLQQLGSTILNLGPSAEALMVGTAGRRHQAGSQPWHTDVSPRSLLVYTLQLFDGAAAGLHCCLRSLQHLLLRMACYVSLVLSICEACHLARLAAAEQSGNV